MPLVRIKYWRGLPQVPEEVLRGSKFLTELREIIASALTVSGSDCELTANDILVELDPVRSGDVGFPAISFLIETGYHPERARNLDDRRHAIVQFLRRTLMATTDRIEGFVWIKLVPDSFETL